MLLIQTKPVLSFHAIDTARDIALPKLRALKNFGGTQRIEALQIGEHVVTHFVHCHISVLSDSRSNTDNPRCVTTLFRAYEQMCHNLDISFETWLSLQVDDGPRAGYMGVLFDSNSDTLFLMKIYRRRVECYPITEPSVIHAEKLRPLAEMVEAQKEKRQASLDELTVIGDRLSQPDLWVTEQDRRQLSRLVAGSV